MQSGYRHLAARLNLAAWHGMNGNNESMHFQADENTKTISAAPLCCRINQPHSLNHFVHLQARNEELVIKAAKVSEEDMAAVQAECERRLGAAEHKVYALVKERDALRRGSDKLSSAHDLLKEKDSIIAQV